MAEHELDVNSIALRVAKRARQFERDPFTRVQLPNVVKTVADIQDRLRDLAELVDQMGHESTSVRLKEDLRRAVGLVQHAEQDVRGVGAVLLITRHLV